MKPLALVVENDGGTRTLLDAMLSRAGLEVDLVSTASDAQILAEKLDYDIVLLDLFFPGGRGEDVLRWMSEHRPGSIRKVVVLSSAPDHILDRVRAEWPQVRVVRKPFDVAEIFSLAETAAKPRPRAVTPEEKFCRRSVCAGAKAGLVARCSGDVLDVVTYYGYDPKQVEEYYAMPLSAPYPICASVRNARPVWFASLSLAQSDYPMLAPVWQKNESRALAVVPLIRDGNVIGVAGWSFREPRLFNEREQRAFFAIAELAAAMIEEHDQSGASAGA